MKSLKRTLCLVLALVMVLGLFGVASASSFTDDNTIQYKEAVDVMTAIGAISGYTDGSFGPNGTIKRAEAAKLVTYAVLGKDAADRLTGDVSKFSDVTVAGGWGWAIPSISYLTSLGVINGRGDGTFDPNGQITGYEVGKLLLCALGYGAKGEYTGAGWDFQVAVDGGKYGIFTGRAANSAALSNPATRQEVALYCFNTIQLPMVEYVTTLDIYRNLGTTAQGAENKTIQNSIYPSLIKTAFNAATPGEDAFGNPANVWSYRNQPIGAYPVAATFTYTAETKSDAVTKDLKAYAFKSGGAVLVKNGGTPAKVSTAADIADLTGNGIVVSVYTKDGKIDTVTVVKKVLAEVIYVNTATETVQLQAVADTDYGADVTLNTTLGYGAVKVGDYVVLETVGTGAKVTAGDTVVKLVPATVVTGVANTKDTVNGTVTVGGKVYVTAAGFNLAGFDITDKSDATLLLDEYGYVKGAKAGSTVSSDNVIAISEVYQTLTNNKIVNMVKGVTSGGQTVELPYASGIKTDGTDLGTLKKYTPDGKGAYTFAAVDSWTTTNAYTPDSASNTKTPFAFSLATQTIAKTAKTASVTYDTDKTQTYYYSADVKFIFADSTGGKVTVVNGVQPVTSKTAVYALKSAGKTYEVTAVFVDGAPETGAGAASDLLFLAQIPGSTVISGTKYDTYTMLQNGMPVSGAYGAAGGINAQTGVGKFYTGIKDEKTGAWKLTAYTPGTSSLQTIESAAGAVAGLNSAKTIITTAGGSIDVSKAVIMNLDTKAVGNVDQIAAALAAFKAHTTTKVPMIAAIYEKDSGVASYVYFYTVEPPAAPEKVSLTIPKAATDGGTLNATITVAGSDGKAVTTEATKNDTLTVTVTFSGAAKADAEDDTVTIGCTVGGKASNPTTLTPGGKSYTMTKAAGNVITLQAAANSQTVTDTYTFEVTASDAVVLTITHAAA